jgi:hypothetical protein
VRSSISTRRFSVNVASPDLTRASCAVSCARSKPAAAAAALAAARASPASSADARDAKQRRSGPRGASASAQKSKKLNQLYGASRQSASSVAT